MKAATIRRGGGPEVFGYEDIPEPRCGEGDVLIRTQVISVEGGDLLARTREPPSVPHVIGYCAAGEVIEVGSGVDHVGVGDRVTTFAFAGSYAEQRVARAEHCWRLPSNLEFAQGVAVPVTFGTAHDCLFEIGRLQADETVLIQGATGSVGVAALQLAKRAGARVIAIGKSEERLAALRAFGPDALVSQQKGDIVDQVMVLTAGKGANLALDPIGGSSLQRSLACLGQRGRLVSLGRAAREPMILDITTLGRKQQSVMGMVFGLDMGTQRVREIIEQLLKDVAGGTLVSVTERAFPLSSAGEAHAYAESAARGLGRVLLLPETA